MLFSRRYKVDFSIIEIKIYYGFEKIQSIGTLLMRVLNDKIS